MSKMNLRCCRIWGTEKRLSVNKPHPMTSRAYSQSVRPDSLSIATAGEVVSRSRPLEVQLRWKFQGERDVFPWMLLRLSREEKVTVALLVKGLCAPEATEGIYTETWRVVTAEHLLPGDYSLEALFVDNSKRAWFETNRSGGGESTLLSAPVSLGHIKVER